MTGIKTTMKKFQMCDSCLSEYKDILDRRFHAQPVACENCGPSYQMIIDGKKFDDINEIITIASDLIKKGKIVCN